MLLLMPTPTSCALVGEAAEVHETGSKMHYWDRAVDQRHDGGLSVIGWERVCLSPSSAADAAAPLLRA